LSLRSGYALPACQANIGETPAAEIPLKNRKSLSRQTRPPLSERKLRPSVIQRKITNGYRAMWAAKAEAEVRSTVDTAKLKGATTFDVIAAVIA
jgi:hypothetical protein